MKIKFLPAKISNKIFPMRIGVKVALAYFVVIAVSIVFSVLVFQRIYLDSTWEKVSEVSMQTLSSIQTSVNFTLENANNYSKMIFSDAGLQTLLRKGDIYSNLHAQARVSGYLYNLIQAVPVIESVCIFDNSDNIYSVSTKTPIITFLLENVRQAEWYGEVTEKKGAFILKLNGGGAFSESANGNYVSLIRQIRDINDTSPLGVLVINIPEKAFRMAYSNTEDEDSLHVAILDENNNSIVKAEGFGAEYDSLLLEGIYNCGSGYFVKQIDSKDYLISYISGNPYGWKYISMMPFDDMVSQYPSLGSIALLIFAANGLVLFFSSIIISRTVTVPVNQLLKTMRRVENGILEEAPVKTKSFEFRQLFLGYNSMVAEIKHLLTQVKEEQNILRKAELNTLQAQIKPHFLYNALDSIMSLALSGDNTGVCKLVDALGSYYRASVSKGREVISVGEEVAIVKDYLCIQKIRYPDLFDVRYDIDESCLNVSVLKLVLQPLVENALYHGIRAKGEPGLIYVGVKRVNKNIELMVADDGAGMSAEKIHGILNCDDKDNQTSFGLWGTLERVRIFYGGRDCFRLESELGSGTKITLIIPDGEVPGQWKS